MALFSRTETATAAARSPNLKPVPRPAPASESAEDARIINGEASARRNVPAVAMGTARRPSVSMPMSAPRGELSAGERRLIVGRDIALAGEIAECDQLVVEGSMDATLRSGKRLDIYATGLYRGAATVQEADIAGRFEGELNVSGRLCLRASSQISGRIRYGEIEVEAGAQLSGEFQFAGTPAANDVQTDITYPSSYNTGTRS